MLRYVIITKIIIMKIIKKKSPLLPLALFFFIIAGDSGTTGAERLVFPVIAPFDHIVLSRHLEYFEDESAALGIEDILSGSYSDKFVPLQGKSPIIGFTRSAFWLRFDMKNPTAADYQWYLEVPNPDYDRIDLFVVHNGSVLDERKTGDLYPFRSREIRHTTYLFTINQKPGAVHSYYVRIQTRSAVSLVLDAWSPDRLRDMMKRDLLLTGLYYGAMIITLLFNLFFFISMRDRNYLYYLLFLSFFMFFQMTDEGLAFQYIWPNSTWWTNNCLPFFIFSAIVFLIMFTRKFLDLRDLYPRFDRVFLLLLFFSAAHIPFSFLIGYGYAIRIAIVCAMVVSVVSLIFAMLVHFRGYRPARYYMASWLLFFITIILYSLNTYSILPVGIMMERGPQAASLVVIILMSLALGDRVNFLRKNLERFNTDLERLVSQRTDEMNKVIRTLEVRDRILQIELDQAGAIQRGILPQTPFYSEGIKVDAYYRSMGKVGGDFFDIFSMQGGHLGVLIADVSGHGMPAAFITALAKISFSETMHSNIFPADIFSAVNTELIQAIKTDDFVTAFLLVFSPSFEVFYCNASHQPPLMLRKKSGEILSWDTNGLFLGAMLASNDMYEDGRDYLEYGDRILLYTDGVVDAVDAGRARFGEDRLRNMLRDTAGLRFEAAMKEMVRQWEAFVGDSDPVDDVTMLLIEIDPHYKELAEHREKGFKLLTEGEYQEAISELEKALDINPMDEKSQLYIGECFLNYGNYPAAVRNLESYLKKNDVDANVWYHLAKAYFILGDYSASGKASQKSTQLRSDYIEAYILYGLSMKNSGNPIEAARTWKRILQIDPDNRVAVKELRDHEAG